MKRGIGIFLIIVLLFSSCGFWGGEKITLHIPTIEDQKAFNQTYISREKSAEETPKEPQTPGYTPGIMEPRNHNLQASMALGLADENGFNGDFFAIQSLYRAVLEKYLYKELSLGKTDRKLKQMGLLPAYEEEKSFRGRYATLPNSFFYLGNNLYIERLSAKQIASLKSAISGETATITREIEALVLNTYPDIIRFFTDEELATRWEKPGEEIHWVFSPTPDCPYLHNDSIVLYLMYNSLWMMEDLAAARAIAEELDALAQSMTDMHKESLARPVEVVNTTSDEIFVIVATHP